MRNFHSTNKRLAAIEGRRGLGIIRLTFADDSTRGVRVAHDYALTLFDHVCEWARAFPPAAPEGMVLDPPPPEPTTPSDKLIALLGEAVAIESREEITFLRTIHAMCQQMSERKKEKETRLEITAAGSWRMPEGFSNRIGGTNPRTRPSNRLAICWRARGWGA
jgi:hypothetical protein